MYKNIPVISNESILSIIPPVWGKIYPICSAFSDRFKAEKNRVPKGATKAMKQVIQKRWTWIGDALNWCWPSGPRYHEFDLYLKRASEVSMCIES